MFANAMSGSATRITGRPFTGTEVGTTAADARLLCHAARLTAKRRSETQGRGKFANASVASAIGSIWEPRSLSLAVLIGDAQI